MDKILLLFAGMCFGAAISLSVQIAADRTVIGWCEEGYIKDNQCHVIHAGPKSNLTKYEAIHGTRN